MNWLNPVRRLRIKHLYASRPYLDAYAAHTDMRVAEDPHEAVGGKWEELGQIQFNFLAENGLKPSSSLLDIGCGTLRAGRHFIRYLDTGHYTGFDLSPAAINYARQLVADEGLLAKNPNLLVNTEKNLRFERLRDCTFDYVLAQSVFTHLPQEDIVECFTYVPKIMHERSVFFFNFVEAPAFTRKSLKLFAYPFSFFSAAAKNAGLSLTRRPDYKHPRGGVMVQAILL